MNSQAVSLLREAENLCDTINADLKYYKRLKNHNMLSKYDEEERNHIISYHTSKLERIWCEYEKCMKDPYHLPRI